MAAVSKSKWKLVYADPEKCVGCAVCEFACSKDNEKAFNPMKSRIRVVRMHPLVNLSVTCRLCDPAPCVLACPRDALEQSEQTGVILVDDDKCDGCGWCIEACDYGAVVLHPELRKVRICDLCDGDPECVKWCPEECLDFVTKDAIAQKQRVGIVQKMFKEALKMVPL